MSTGNQLSTRSVRTVYHAPVSTLGTLLEAQEGYFRIADNKVRRGMGQGLLGRNSRTRSQGVGVCGAFTSLDSQQT